MKLLLSVVLVASVLLISFDRDRKINSMTASREQSVDVRQGSSPYLSKDHKGNTILSWVRHMPDSSSVLCYSILDGHNKTITIPTSNNILPHAENLPKIVFRNSGSIMAVWGAANPNPKNKYSGQIYYSQSFVDGRSWTPDQ